MEGYKSQSGMHNFYLKNSFAKVSFWFDVSSKLMRWNSWDQFQALKFKFVKFHIWQWNLARGRHGHFVWLAFDTDQTFFNLKINFLFEFVPKVLQGCLSFLGLDMFFMVTHLWRGKRIYWFWNQISLWNVWSAPRSLVMASGTHGHFEWLAFDTE